MNAIRGMFEYLFTKWSLSVMGRIDLRFISSFFGKDIEFNKEKLTKLWELLKILFSKYKKGIRYYLNQGAYCDILRRFSDLDRSDVMEVILNFCPKNLDLLTGKMTNGTTGTFYTILGYTSKYEYKNSLMTVIKHLQEKGVLEK